ncbi:unnamed protein product [Sphagnum balticum]
MASTEFEKDLEAMRNLREQAATNANVLSSRDMPVVGFYVTPLRHHLSGSNAGPSSASDFPPGLTLNRVISDYLRAMGNFILRHLQIHVRSDLSMQDVQCSIGLGRIHVEKQFIELVCKTSGPLGEYLLRFPEYESRLLENLERGRAFINLPMELGLAWEEHNKRLGMLQSWDYYRMVLAYIEMQDILYPILEANLDVIAAQLPQTTGIRVMVVVGHLSGLSDLETRIRHRLRDRLGQIVFEEAHRITISTAAVRIAQDCFPGPGTKTFDLVLEVIDNVLIQTRQMDNQDWVNNNYDWGKAAVLQAGNEEAFVGILHDLKWWCTHFLILTILSGSNSSEQIQSLGDVDKLNHFEQDQILARRAALDREELVANFMQFKRHDKSNVMVNHLLERCSQQASDQSTKVESPLLLWNTQDDNTPLILEDLLGRGAYGVVFKSTWLGWNCAKKVFVGAENVSFKKEADILAALKHPNIIQLFCCTTDAKSCSLVMELMSTDLRKLMDEKMKDPKHVVPFSLPVAVDIMLQTKDIGTTQYRAPELYTQKEEEEITRENYPLKADIYSYGITCAEILTGKVPFPYTKYKRSELLQAIRQGERPPLPRDCPMHLVHLIKTCWDTDPCKRPSFLQVCNELLNFKRSNMMI